MKKGNFDNIKAMYFSYERGFVVGYLSAKLGVNWPDIPEEERKLYEDEARKTLEIWNKNCEKG